MYDGGNMFFSSDSHGFLVEIMRKADILKNGMSPCDNILDGSNDMDFGRFSVC